MEWRYRVWEATQEAIRNLSIHPKAQNIFWIRSRTGEDMGFPVVSSLTNSLTRVRERWRETF